jgi:hypothetical protein
MARDYSWWCEPSLIVRPGATSTCRIRVMGRNGLAEHLAAEDFRIVTTHCLRDALLALPDRASGLGTERQMSLDGRVGSLISARVSNVS